MLGSEERDMPPCDEAAPDCRCEGVCPAFRGLDVLRDVCAVYCDAPAVFCDVFDVFCDV